MKAAVISDFKGKLSIEKRPIPEVGPKDILVKIHACGVCHTDLHACQGDWPVKPTLPLVPSHEGVGEIVSLGSQISHLAIGDRVGIPWLYSACGQCEYCFAHGEYVVKIPDTLSHVDAAPLFCADVATYKALKVSEVKSGQW